MNTQTHTERANFIWSICNLLRGPYKRNEYRKVILPLTVLRRFDCVLAGTKEEVLAAERRSTADRARPVRRKLAGGKASVRISLLQHFEAGLSSGCWTTPT